MTGNNIVGIIYSNIYDECLSEMTGLRTMGSVPFAGRYRLIDFPLSNMVNSGIEKVGVITKSNYQSLMDHLGTGKAWDLSRKRDGLFMLPPFNNSEEEYRNRISALLQEESSLMEIVKLIGSDVLPDDQKLVIETARVIRVGFLQQNAFHADDTYVPLEKQKLMMKTILHLHAKAKDIVAQNIPLSKILNLGLFDKLTKMKYDIPNSKPEMFDDYIKEIDEKLAAIS